MGISLFELFGKYAETTVGKHNGIPDKKFDKKQLGMGIAIEKEHTDSPEVAKNIAKDHLSEYPKTYYTRLKKLEEQAAAAGDVPKYFKKAEAASGAGLILRELAEEAMFQLKKQQDREKELAELAPVNASPPSYVTEFKGVNNV